MLPVAILAGGLATRLGPLTKTIPKALIAIEGEPFVAHQLRLLRENGIQHVILCVGHLGEMIERELGNGRQFGMRIDYSYDGVNLRGTAGAIRNALPKLGSDFFVLYGDSYLPCDYAAVERRFSSSGKLGLMTVYRNQGQWDTSNVEFADGQIVAYSKKDRTARMNFIDYGLGVFRADAFVASPAADLADLYSDLLRTGQLAGLEVEQRFYEIGSHAGLQELMNLLSAQRNRRDATGDSKE
jgi:NDP-sugar pyrophosphorylase family protein